MGQRHIIKKIVFELEVESQEAISGLEDAFREVITDAITPQLEVYCDEIDEINTVVCLERLELNFGRINKSTLLEDLRSKVAVYFKNKQKITHPPIEKLRIEQVEREQIIYFLQTGLLPWRSVKRKNENWFSLKLESLLKNDSDSIATLVKYLKRNKQTWNRFILHASDKVLLAIFELLFPQSCFDLISDLRIIWNEKQFFGSPPASRLHFWKIITAIYFQNDLKSIENIFHSFIQQWASICKISNHALLALIADLMKRKGATIKYSRTILELLANLNNKKDKQIFLKVAWQHELLRLSDHDIILRDELGLIQIQMGLVRIVLNQSSFLTNLQQEQLMDHLKEFLSLSPMKRFLPGEDNFIMKKKERFLAKNMADDLKGFESILQKIKDIRNEYSLPDNSLTLTIYDLISKKDEFDSTEKFILFLQKLGPVMTALSESVGSGELRSYINHLKEKLSYQLSIENNDLVRLFYNLEENVILRKQEVKKEEIDVIIRQLNIMLKSIPNSIFPASDKMAYGELLNEITKESVSNETAFEKIREFVHKDQPLRLSEKGIMKQEPFTEDDVYVFNAGLVLLAPFINSLFTKLQYVADNSFVNRQRSVEALMLLQYIVDPEQKEHKEFDLALNKMLCGFDITATVDLLQASDQAANTEAENMIEEILQQVSVFKNISREGFRNAFLKREGVLSHHGDHWLLKVSKQTFDIVLEKLPWQFSVVRLPWMPLPIMIEW